MASKNRTGARPRFRVGDRVQFPVGNLKTVGTIAEDRGPVALGGDRLYRVHVAFDAESSLDFEMSEADLEPAEQPA